jgi:hypothetical protein
MSLFGKFNDKQIKTLIVNYRNAGKTAESYYHALLEENSRRTGNGLDFEKTLEAVKQAASEERYLSYLELAERSGCTWNKVRHGIPRHLQALLEYCHDRGLPLLSAIVVNKHNASTGKLDEDALNGFVKGVEEIGLKVSDPEAFLKAEQQKIFAWVKGG